LIVDPSRRAEDRVLPRRQIQGFPGIIETVIVVILVLDGLSALRSKTRWTR
jgi:hypothetical protein